MDCPKHTIDCQRLIPGEGVLMHRFSEGQQVEVLVQLDSIPEAWRGKRGVIRALIEPTSPLFELNYAVDLAGSESPIVISEAWLIAR